ncbi:oligoketide cyclase/lipid transport protein [Halobacteroides halobius DSM 5150]|uniref:Oligoketide cyclase/lipid transport protein n=1 Tax=Halobacteroides halobius (strain ATCC 35273 / DSM 5150 / MD-1) TaxID=748449 RepID=L0K891_HALHC|nr:SRPBCC family protein [Halobacteroides halobius]AGB41497.1 oligoketide cyclase/lipid transport protein [Halobacteroides halobius DSM 5150]
MPQVVESIILNGSIDKAYQLAKDMESYPQFMENVISVKVLKRDKKSTITSWETKIDGRSISWKEKDLFNDDGYEILYQQLEGDLKKFEGKWDLKEVVQGVKITLSVEFEFGVAMLAPLLNPILKKKVRSNSKNMLEAIKQKVETEKRKIY